MGTSGGVICHSIVRWMNNSQSINLLIYDQADDIGVSGVDGFFQKVALWSITVQLN